MAASTFQELQGRTVLVHSKTDRHNPPTALRGTIEVHPGSGQTREAAVQVALEFPQMFEAPAHHQTITLRDDELRQLLASEREGTYELAIDEPLDERT